MREMNKLILSSLVKVFFVCIPVAGFFFYISYVVIQAMAAHGMKQFDYVPVVVAVAFSCHIARLVIGGDMRRMAELRREARRLG
jgi:hypothetical protein